MIKKKIKKMNLKSESGITMMDLIVALAIFTVFTGVITALMFSSYKTNLQLRMSGAALNYTIEILEDIDKISYDEVTNGMEDSYRSKFEIPSGFNLNLEVGQYDSNSEKLIKKVKVTVAYEISGKTEKIVINKLKIKEV